MRIRPAGGWSSETIISIILVGQSVIFQWHKMWHNDFNYYCWTQSGWAVRTLDLKFSIQRCFVTWTILLPNKHNVPVTCWYWCFKDGSHNDWLNGLHIIQWLTVLHCGKCRHHVVKSVHCYNTEHLKHCWTHFWQFGQIRYSGAFFFKPGDYITHNAIQPLSDITGGNLSDYMQRSLEPQKTLYHFFTYSVELTKTCKHTFWVKLVK